MSDALQGPLVWIVQRHAVNPQNIVDVFHGAGGEVQVTLVGGRRLELHEDDLTLDGRRLLLPSETCSENGVESFASAFARH
jgi:hypothetical protein